MPEHSHQLAAILFADIVNYTAMMQEDENTALEKITRFRHVIDIIVEELEGKIIQYYGDGCLVLFNSATDAVEFAKLLQTDFNEDPKVPVRIGIHMGDVLLRDGNVFGDVVNIASRIQALAPAGGIYISEMVYRNIANKKGMDSVFIKEEKLKNVKTPIRIYEVLTEYSTTVYHVNADDEQVAIDENSIAVLPFVNMSSDKEQEYFSDGLTEELISGLSRLKDTKVISRTTSMKYKNTTKDTKTIGKETGADYIMEGSVRKAGNNLRITAQFIDACRDVHLWAQSFRGTLDDIFDIQEDVSVKIIEALRIQLSSEEKNTLQKRYTDNTEAYQLYLQGIFFWKKRNEAGLKLAVKHFEKALEKDPEYALAWAGIADAYSLMGEYTNISRRDLYNKQMEAVHKALELDPQLAEAHVSLAISLMLNDWDWVGAEKEFRTGLKLNPKYATGHHWYAELLMFLGRSEEAFKEISVAVELDPTSQGILKDKGIFHYYHKQFDEAISTALTTSELDPGFVPVHRLLSLIYTANGRYEDAIRENKRWGELTGNKVKTDVALAYILATCGRKDEARKIIEETGIDKILSSNDYRGVALVYVGLEETEKAFEWLDKSYQKHEESLCSIGIDHKFDPIRNDPRFKELMKKVRLI